VFGYDDVFAPDIVEVDVGTEIEWCDTGGIVPNSLDTELLPPQREAHIVGNLVIDNNNAEAPTKGLARLAWGEGIVVVGGRGNVVEKNLVVNHDRYGIVTTMLPDKNIYMATDNVVRDNTVARTSSHSRSSARGWRLPSGTSSDARMTCRRGQRLAGTP
jgi:hypothetical protein